MSAMAWMNERKRWAFVASGWGDVLASLSAVQELRLRNVLYFGHMSHDIKEFLEAQPGIQQVITVHSHDLGISKGDFFRMAYHFFDRTLHSDQILLGVLEKASLDIRIEEIYNACIDSSLLYQPNIQARDLVLPDTVNEWLIITKKHLDLKNYVLVHPYSFASTPLQDHWPHWKAYLDWLFSHENVQFVLTGLHEELRPYGSLGHVLDLCNQIPTNMHVMGLASGASAVITTLNSLAHWCNSQDVRCVAFHNRGAAKPQALFERICTSQELYSVGFHASLEAAVSTTRHALNLSGENPIARHLMRDFWAEESCSMASIYNRMPAIPRGDFLGDWAQAGDGFDLIRKIAEVIQPESYYEIGARVGHRLLAFCAGSERMKRAGWCDNESGVRNSNRMLCHNLNMFGARYGKPVEYAYVTDVSLAQEHMRGYQVVAVNGEPTRKGKIRDLDMALQSKAELILVDDYFYFFLPVVRYAICEWAIQNKQPLHIIHTFRGLAIFDTTPNRRHIESLRAHGIACDILACEKIRF